MRDLFFNPTKEELPVNTREVAEALGTDSKRLRRFLRADPTYRNAGQGGRYEFKTKDLPTLRKRFSAWDAQSKPAEKSSATTPRRRKAKGDDTMPVSILGRKLTDDEREQRDRVSRERVDRLEARLRATGKHISQMRDRERTR